MYIKGFNVELLVDNKPLKEYNIPTTELEVPTTGRSFVYNEVSEEIEFFSFLNFAAVPITSINYVIRVSSDKVSRRKPMLARVYVDGFDDSTSLRLITKSPTYKDGFKNVNRQLKHPFQFSNSNKVTFTGRSKRSVSSTSNKRNMQYGGLGSVSVYFYMARVLADSSVRLRKDTFDPIAPDTRHYSEITTKFGSGVKYEQTKHLRKFSKPLVKFGNTPIAVLHLHYRSCEWFIEKNISGFNADIFTSKNSTKLVSDSNSSNGIKVKSENESTDSTILISGSNSSNGIKVKSENESTKVKVEDESPIVREEKITIKEENVKIKVEDNGNLRGVKQEKRDVQSQSSITLGKRKRKSIKYREIIEIIDSDEEDHEIIYLD